MLATFAYDDLGRRTSLTRGNGLVTTYGYDAVSRLDELDDDPAGASYDQQVDLAFNPASQIVTRTCSNDLYAWNGHGSGTTNSTANGLNQITAHGGVATAHDGRGNMTSDGSKTYGYTVENLLTSSGGTTLAYDPLTRLAQVGGRHAVRLGRSDGLSGAREPGSRGWWSRGGSNP